MQREARARSRSPIARAKIHRHSGALPQPPSGDSSPPEPRKARMYPSALVPTRTSVQSFFTSTLDAIHTCPPKIHNGIMVRTKSHIPLPKAARRGGYAGCGFAAHYKPTAARTFSITGAAAARAFFAPSRKMSSSASGSFSSSSRLALNGSNILLYAARSAFFAWP